MTHFEVKKEILFKELARIGIIEKKELDKRISEFKYPLIILMGIKVRIPVDIVGTMQLSLFKFISWIIWEAFSKKIVVSSLPVITQEMYNCKDCWKIDRPGDLKTFYSCEKHKDYAKKER